MKKFLLAFCAVLACAPASSTIDVSAAAKQADPGALVAVSMSSKVGVLLDEVPASMRDRAAAAYLAQPDSFWIARAHSQLHLTFYRLVFRQLYYDDGSQQLPLPPEPLWNVTVKKAQRIKVKGHDLIAADYAFSSTLLTDLASPGVSEKKLANIGGVWDEPFSFPIDPELLFQRTRFACMDEGEFPPNSVDSEEVDSFYDQTCDVEQHLTNTGCHQTELPATSCLDALDAKVGRIDAKLHFQRLKWDAALASQVRYGTVTNQSGADLVPVSSEFHVNRTIYRYFAPNDCAFAEQCIQGTKPGWRRLLQFATADQNTGTQTLDIGAVDYFIDGTVNPLQAHGDFEYSACHNHYHFTHYGSFAYGTTDPATTSKRGFCLQSTNRFSNREDSPLHNPYFDCGYQGVDVGWVDEYKAGLPCQWIDVTGVDTSQGPVTRPLSFQSNPDGFLCEGTKILDANGNLTWVPTSFRTAAGLPEDKPGCNYFQTSSDPQAWLSNNTETYDVTMQTPGNGYVTASCDRGQVGHLRNCGLAPPAGMRTCTPGAKVSLACSVPAGSAPQVVRACEASAALGSGTACTYQDSLTSFPVDGLFVASFTCPAARDAAEPGGLFALYTGPVLPGDPAVAVTCVQR